MAELRPHYIDVDLKKNTQYNVPVVTQNDTATHFIIRVTDDGLSDPELLDAYQEITMTSQRLDGESFYLTGTRIPGTNEIEFHLGTDETAFSGSVLASLQFYLVEDASRYTSAQFRYDVKKDLTTNYTPTQREETLVEVVLRDGPGVIQEAKDAKVAVEGALVELEQDKTDAIERLDEVTEENKTVFRQPVNTFADLATTYPNPEHGTTVRVTGESATYRYSDGSWVKTDEYNPTAIDQVTAQLADIAINARDFSAVGDGSTDDTSAIQNVIDFVHDSGGGTVILPKGVYRVGLLQGKSNVILAGVNKESVLKSYDGRVTHQYAILNVGQCENFHINNITFDGNESNVQDNEQMHSLRFDRAVNCSVKNCKFQNSRGDGIIILGIDYPSKDIVIEDNVFNTAKRNSITMGSGFQNIYIHRNHFEGKGGTTGQFIDCEPSWDDAVCSGLHITDNYFDGTQGGGTITTSTQIATGYDAYSYITGNRIINGSIRVTYSRKVWIANNSIMNTQMQLFAPIFGGYVVEDIYVKGNYIYDFIQSDAIWFNSTSSFQPKNINIQDNRIEGSGIKIVNTSNVSILNNKMRGDGTKNGIMVYSNTDFIAKNTFVSSNILDGYSRNIEVAALSNSTVERLFLINNMLLNHTSRGIAISDNSGSALVRELEISGNTIESSVGNALVIPTNLFYRTSGNKSSVEFFIGTGTPEGKVTATRGSSYSRTDGSTGTSFYIKESSTGNTGWAAK